MKKYIEIKEQIIAQGTNQTKVRNLSCEKLITNDATGFSACMLENQNGFPARYTANFKMVGDKVEYTFDYCPRTQIELMRSGFEYCIHQSNAKPDLLDLEFAVYDLEHPIAAVAINHKIACEPIRKKFKQMYPKYKVK
jgi:hypothetical protein